MHVFHDVENRFGAGQIRRVDQGREPPPPGVRIDPGQRHRRIGDTQQVVENQEVVTVGVGKLVRSCARAATSSRPPTRGRSAEQPRHGMERDLARMGFAICGKHCDAAAFGDLRRLRGRADSFRSQAVPPHRPPSPRPLPHGPGVPTWCALPARAPQGSTAQVRLSHARQPPQAVDARARRAGALDRHHFRIAEQAGRPDELRGGIAEHDPAWRRGGLHPLGHPDLVADSGVTNCGGTEFTSYHLARIQPDPQAEADTIPPIDVGCHILDFPSGSPRRPYRRVTRDPRAQPALRTPP